MKGVELHPEAYNDLDEIGRYISQDSPDAAKRLVTRIFDRIGALVAFPRQGHLRVDLTSRPMLFVPVYDYLIAYAPDERPVWIIAVIHGSRNPRVIAAILRERESRPS